MAAAAATTTTAFPFNLTREQYIYMAKLAKKAERYEEMAKFMKNLVIGLPTPVSELTIEERYLLSMAYKEVSGSLRSAWRIISSKEKSRKNDVDIDIVVVKYYRSEIEDKISDVCLGILKILESNLVPSASRADSKVFYLKMKGDYFRYLAEFKVGDERREAGEQAMNSYKAAQDIAEADMDPTHPLRLGVALDFSVFYYEILNSAYIACSMAKKAYMDAFDELDNVSEECYKDSTRIMQLLRNNLTLWTSNTQSCKIGVKWFKTAETWPNRGSPQALGRLKSCKESPILRGA